MMTVDGVEIGECLYGSTMSIVDYSNKERNFDGSFVNLLQREYSDKVDYKVIIESKNIAQIRTLLASKRASPLVEYGAVGTDIDLSVTGILVDFEITTDFNMSSLTLEVQGVLKS